MAGIIVQLVISWILLWVFAKRNLLALGLAPTADRLKQFATGFLIGLLFLSAFYFLTAWLIHAPYRINPGYTVPDFLSAVLYVLRSVLFEELIFRGAILYILILRIGATKAVLVSAVSFGIYHWFSYGIIGQPVNMIVIFAGTGIVGYVLASAFYRTQSMYLPIALHLGYNFTAMVIFSSDRGIGSQLLMQANGQGVAHPGFVISALVTLVYFTGFPLLAYLYVRRQNATTKPLGER